MPRLIVVSNRVTLPDQASPTGGLAVGVLAALKSSADGGVWLGWSGKTSEHPGAPQVQRERGIEFVTTDLPAGVFEQFYNGFCNGSLWPLHHYFPGAFRYDAAEFDAYMAINRCYRDVLKTLVKDGDTVWVHDYQLIPLGALLRESGVNVRIGFFLHIPYPNLAVLRLLPPFADLVRALCQYDLLGFQTEEDVEGFLSAVRGVYERELPGHPDSIRVDSREVRLGAFPIGVDVEVIAEQAGAAAQEDVQVKRLAHSMLGRQLLLGVDRLDYSKGLVERFDAYRTLLERDTDLQGNVTFIQIAPLSRTQVPAYSVIRDDLERHAGHINGKFADADWTPIRYLNKDFAHQTLSGFLRLADVGVVTPLRDGMNLVAKEYVAAQDPDSPGVLVLSSLAGAAHELADGALLVNPYDRADVARALKSALTMRLEERCERHATMMRALEANSIGHWHEGFLSALREPG